MELESNYMFRSLHITIMLLLLTSCSNQEEYCTIQSSEGKSLAKIPLHIEVKSNSNIKVICNESLHNK